MRECCATCAYRYTGEKTDFTKLKTGENIDTPMEGFICMAFANEGVANWMVGSDEEKGICEMYKARKEQIDG